MIRRAGPGGEVLASRHASDRADRLGAWCGWLVAGAFALLPALGWLGPLGIPILVALVGLLALPALRIEDHDRPIAVLLLVSLLWAAVSTVWSPFHPSKPANNTALKLALELPLYWSAICAARRASPPLKRLALQVLAWGSALFGLVLLVEFITDVRLYEILHTTFYQPIRHDLAQSNIGHATFVLALLWPLALAAAMKLRAPLWLALPMAAGVLAPAVRFASDAPVLSVPLAAGVGIAAWRWPRGGPRALAGAAVVYCLAAPLLVWAGRASGRYGALEAAIQPSWSERMSYWSHALDWTRDHPVRGWGLDASRMFGPGIILHPHDDALQVWLELGLVGALLMAAIWWLAVSRLARRTPQPWPAGVAASASVYLLFGAVNFGVWQEWWLALAAMIAMASGLMAEPDPSQAST